MQPSHRQRQRRPAPPTSAQRIRRALGDPRRFKTALIRNTANPRARLALALGRPLPEEIREMYFFGLHHVAEVSYVPRPYPGELLAFSGEGLYEDPELGWSGLASGGVRSVPVPGEHTNNRHLMREPAVSLVAASIQEYLGP